MSIPTPTDNALPGLPDTSLLARLANEFFAALPGTGGVSPALAAFVPAVPAPAQLPALDAVPALPAVPATAASSPAVATPHAAPPHAAAPHAAAPNGLPDAAAQTAPAAGRPGTALLGAPEGYSAALPAIEPPSSPVSVPSTPYYFVGESSAYPSTASLSPGIGREDRVTARPLGLPGEDELNALLQSIAAPAEPAAGPFEGGSPTTPSQPHFYFVDTPPAVPPSARSAFDVHAIRRDFPILAERVNGKPLVWLDNAATTHKPQAVIDRLAHFYAHENSNIHRAAHELAARATDAYEAARSKVARFLGASSSDEIVFVRGATEAINLVAQSWGRQNVSAGDEIVVSHLEHHANIVPWQLLAQEKGAHLRVIPVDDHGQIRLDEYRRLLSDRTRIVAVTQVSNALGTIVPVRDVIAAAHGVGARVLIDGAQSVSHLRVNMQALDTDFFVFSGHKIFAPTGIGVVYGKRDLLDSMPPWQGGGNMIADVTFEKTVYQAAPSRFEAGTGNIADAVGLGAALDYLERIGIENVARYEHELLEYAMRAMRAVPGLRLIGTAADKTSVLSFVLDGYRVDEVGQALSREGIAVRAGHHCAQPILRRFGLEATVRPSLAFYNTCAEIDSMVAVLLRLAHARRTPRQG